MTRRLALLSIVLGGWTAIAAAQTFSPQSPSGLNVSFTTERAGGSRVLIFGDVRNATNAMAEHVVILAEGLDESGRVVSRGRCYVAGTVPSRGTSPFEIRLSAAGSEKRYRVSVEAFQFLQSN
jgi:hypothetical protein